MPDQFYIIDGHSQVYRHHFGNHAKLTSRSGEPTTATYGFVKMVLKLLREKQPAYLAVAMDGPRHLLKRRELDPEYKNQRGETPAEITVQVKRITQILKALNIVTLKVEGYEADDIIATLATRCVSDDVHVSIVTGDKDMGGLLVDTRIRLFDPQRNEYTGIPEFIEQKGFHPSINTQVLAMMGDSTDNVPPIGGFGEKTAAKWLKEFGSLTGLISNKAELPPRLYECLQNAINTGRLALNLRLVELIKDVPLCFDPAKLSTDGFSVKPASHIFEELGFARWYE